ALEYLQKSLQCEPNNTLTLRLLADAYHMLNQHDSALRNLNKLLQIEPNDTIAFRIAEELFDIEHASSNSILDMKNYKLSDVGAMVLAKALESNSSLTFLNLQSN